MKKIIFNNSATRVIQQVLIIFILNTAVISNVMSQELMSGNINNCNSLSITNIKNSSIIINDVVWPIIFEDGNYTEDLLNFVTKDLQMIYSRGVFYELKMFENETFNIGGCPVKSYEYLQFTHNFPVPDKIHLNFYSIVELEGQKYLVVAKKLIDAYKKAYDFNIMHKEKFNKLLSFINQLNSITSLDTMTKEEIKACYFTGLLSEAEKNMFFPENANKEFLMKFSYTDIKFYNPSVLSIYNSEHENATKGLIMAEVPYYSVMNKRGNSWAFIYSDNKWQIVLFIPEV